MKRVQGALIFFFLLSLLCPIEVFPDSGKAAQDTAVKGAVSTENSGKAAPKSDGAAAGGGDSPGNMGLYEGYRAEEGDPEPYGWLIFKTILVIGLLVGGFYFFFRFVTQKAGFQVLGKDVVQVLSAVPLGQNKFLHVVDLAGKVIVLGVTDSSINFITEVSEKNEIDRIRMLSMRDASREPVAFQDFLAKQVGKLLNRKGDEHRPAEREAASAIEMDRIDYLKRQRERLRKINGSGNEV